MYLQGQEQEWESGSGSECPDGLHHIPPPPTPSASPTPGLAGERSTKEGVGRVDPGSRSRGRSLVGGRSAVLGEGDDRRDKEVGLLCGDPTSESVGRSLGLGGEESEGSHAGLLLIRRSLGLDGEEGRGESRVGRSSIGGHLG